MGIKMASDLYYLPGHGGKITTGLGEALAARGFSVRGRETTGEFQRLAFHQQVDAVADDLRQMFWHQDARVIAVSFGAYLFLHAQAQLPHYIGRVLLLSPIVGKFSSEALSLGFIPPCAEKLLQLAEASQFAAPTSCQIYVGSEDWQSNPKDVTLFARMLSIPVTVVPNMGHQLEKQYVEALLDRWLPNH